MVAPVVAPTRLPGKTAVAVAATIAVTVGLYHITFTATNAAAQRDGA